MFSLLSIFIAMRKLFWVIVSIFMVAGLKAQQDPQLSHYMFVTSYYNPGFAGVTGNVSVNLLSRNQWMKFEGAPQTQVLTIDAPVNIFGMQAGVGAKIMNDQYAFVNDLLFGLMFSKAVSLPVGMLNIGVSMDLFSKNINPQWNFPDQTENLISGQANSMVLDFDLGIFYTYNNFFSGFSVTHLTAPNFVFVAESGARQQIGLVRHYYFTSGYNFSLPGTLFDITPSTLIKSDGHIVQVDVNVNVLYNKKIWAGVSYRNGESIVAFFGTSYFKDIKIGVSYDALLNSIGRASSGSFEVYVGYNFAILKMEKPQHYHNVKTL